MACYSNQMLCLVFVLAVVVLCTIECAPLHNSDFNKPNSITDHHLKSGRNKRTLSETYSQHDTKLGLVINNEEVSGSDIVNINRRKRSLEETEALGIQASSTSHSRSKRSAAWFLSAAIKLCDNHPLLCKTIQVEDKDLKMTIRLEEM